MTVERISFPVSGRVPQVIRIALRYVQDAVNRIVAQVNEARFDLTNAYNLPISTGVSGLGAGIATFLGTPTSANLKAAVTDETGTGGALVFATSPTLTTPSVIGSVAAHTTTAIPAGGTAGAGYVLSSTANFGIFFGSGDPAISAAQGSLYMRSDGFSDETRLYVNADGSTTWVPVKTVI